MLKNRHCPCHIIANDHAEAIPQRVSQKKRIEPSSYSSISHPARQELAPVRNVSPDCDDITL